MFLVGAYAIAHLADVSVSSLTRDVVASERLPWYQGSLSWLGVLIWFGGSSIAVAASFRAQPPHRGWLRAFGLFGMVLAIDDGFMLHEYTLPRLIGADVELMVFAAYAAVAVWIGVIWFRGVAPLARDFAVVAILGLSASVAGDFVGAPAFVEDALKFIGVVAWAGAAVAGAAHAVPAALPVDLPASAHRD